MKLIIAEKPSLARNIASAIGNLQKRNGYMEGEGYFVTWCFGHLFSLLDIEDYTQPDRREKVKWRMENLPFFPEHFRFQLKKGDNGKEDEGVKRQFETIRDLCNRPDVDTLINAGDADREGEIIVRLCVSHALKTQKPFLRLWLPDQTPETVRKALSEMKPEEEYKSLANEGYARTYIDWLYGVNLTRLASLQSGALLRVGRVIIPIVKAIYDRDMEIRNFVPEKYYGMVSKTEVDGQTVELTSKNKFTKDELQKAQAVCKQYNDTGATVTGVKRKKDTLSPGKLYSLSTLQNVLSKKYKMSMADSLKIVQELYEKGFLTYPRTNSEYLATAEKDKIKQILGNVKKLGYPVAFREDKSIFDDSKIESHSALTPTYKIPGKGVLSEREQQVYATVFRRFVAVFCAEPCKVDKTEITVDVGKLETFTLKGTIIEEPGWTKYDDYHGKDKILPLLTKGQHFDVDFQPTEKETTAPKHYTVETLNNYLKNPFRDDMREKKEGEGDEEDYRAIFEGLELGTEATRTGIIENARKSQYIELKKDTYYILPGGEFLMQSLSQMQISMDKYKTSQLGQALKKVYHSEMTVEDSVAMAQKEITDTFSLAKNGTYSFVGDVLGVCPLCGGQVSRKRTFYGCANYKNGCKFSLNLSICQRFLSPAEVKKLLETGETGVLSGFYSQKKNKYFEANLKMKDGRAEFEFPKTKREPTPTTYEEPVWDDAPPVTGD